MPQQKPGASCHSTKNTQVLDPWLGPLGGLLLVPCTLLFLTLTKLPDSKTQRQAIQLLLHGKTNQAPSGGTGEERSMQHFQLCQCCVVVDMRNDPHCLVP